MTGCITGLNVKTKWLRKTKFGFNIPLGSSNRFAIFCF